MLGKRHRTALERLRYECDYEDHHKGGTENFILLPALGSGIGAKTVADLLEWGMIVEGPNRWFREMGYRITEAGRSELNLSRSR